MENMIANNSSYCVQRIFLGKNTVSDLIQKRLYHDLPQFLPLTSDDSIIYNNHGDCSVVIRHNGN